ncbi:MAG TPA: alkaline phosphatase family protein [Burkholderiaceae bacterium]|nr:alkaline phosphatase family protein [Burkholderiaceae bacterium]
MVKVSDKVRAQPLRRAVCQAIIGAMIAQPVLVAQPALAWSGDQTASPIKHVIVIIGENRTFDHVFATYEPVNKQEKVLNLLSKGIVKRDGTPGPNYGAALQYSATDETTWQLSPPKTPYGVLPPALVGGTATPYVCEGLGITTGISCVTPANIAAAKTVENGLADDYYPYLLTGGTGQTNGTPDDRIQYDGQSATTLPPGPYQLTNAKTYPYDAYAASPVHRFFQMWQQENCDAAAVTQQNGWGCSGGLFAWVEATVGAGSNGKAPPAGGYPGEGSTALGFFNVQQGDAPYLKYLADTYSMSDNYHQAVMGGTGANHIMLGTGDAIWFSDGEGNPLVPPNNSVNPNTPGTPVAGYASALSEIENPNPMPGTNNFYTQDGYGGGSGSPTATAPNANYGGGSYVGCADPRQPGVADLRDYLDSLPRSVDPNCHWGHYYLVNNYNPGYFGDGSNAYTNTNPNNYVFTIPPSSVRNIGDELNEKGITWAYYGDQFDRYLNDPYQVSSVDQYCNICNWAQYSTSIMTSSTRSDHLKDTADLYAAITSGTLPAVSYVKPSGFVDGHPASSKLILFEGFVKKIVDMVKANPKLWAETAIFITFDEGGGYYDSGYVQPLDFFGDGTRIPMIAVSPFSRGGHISHTYTDHVSTLKFIERNWGLSPITKRSRDNLPNPVTKDSPYVPANSPAIGDLFDLFDFSGHQK